MRAKGEIMRWHSMPSCLIKEKDGSGPSYFLFCETSDEFEAAEQCRWLGEFVQRRCFVPGIFERVYRDQLAERSLCYPDALQTNRP